MKSLRVLFKMCRKSESNFLIVVFRFLIYRILYKKTLLLHQRATIKGVKNLDSKDIVEVGINYVGFMHKCDRTFLNIKGRLEIKGKFCIGRGCRFDIGKEAIVTIGHGGYINCNTTLIIMHRLSIGDNCAISWNCQFLDANFHRITYANKKETGNDIEIGNNVWIGCGTKIYKGTTIPDGCVIASDSIVKGRFDKMNCLIGGNPARILKEDIKWE